MAEINRPFIRFYDRITCYDVIGIIHHSNVAQMTEVHIIELPIEKVIKPGPFRYRVISSLNQLRQENINRFRYNTGISASMVDTKPYMLMNIEEEFFLAEIVDHLSHTPITDIKGVIYNKSSNALAHNTDASFVRFYFVNEQDAILFKLRFG